MNGLVSYESSSDEEDNAPAPAEDNASTQPNNNDTLENDNDHHSSTPAGDHELAAMVGPSLPPPGLEESDQAPYGPEAEEAAPDHVAMGQVLAAGGLSEQDLVRHLTQASHAVSALPPSPPGSPDPMVEARLAKFLELKKKGLHFNADLATKPSFKNPGLLNSLMARAGIDQQSGCYASSLPADVWDPSGLPPHAYKEALARSQQTIRERQLARRRNETATGTRTIEFHRSSSSPANVSK